MLRRHGLYADIPRDDFLMDVQVVEHALRRLVALHVNRVLLQVEGRIRQQGHGLLFGEARVLEHALLPLLWAVGQTPAHTLVKTIGQHVMHEAENIAPEHHLIDVQRGVIGGLLLLRALGIEPDDIVRAAEDPHQPRLGPLHRLHDSAVHIGGEAALPAVIVHVIAVAQVLHLQPFTGRGKLVALLPHARVQLPLDDAAQLLFHVFFGHQQTLRLLRFNGLKPVSGLRKPTAA